MVVLEVVVMLGPSSIVPCLKLSALLSSTSKKAIALSIAENDVGKMVGCEVSK